MNRCRICSSKNLTVILSGPHWKLVCKDCKAHQKFLGKKEAEKFIRYNSWWGRSEHHPHFGINVTGV